jgi:hypothetical protein
MKSMKLTKITRMSCPSFRLRVPAQKVLSTFRLYSVFGIHSEMCVVNLISSNIDPHLIFNYAKID